MSPRLLRAAWLVGLLGCERRPDDRAADCAVIERIIETAVEGVPRRYRDAAIQEHALAELRRADFADATVARVARDAHVTYEQLASLCAPAASDRERDCAAVRAYLRIQPLEAAGIRDESGLRELAERPYLDAAVGRAVVEVVRTSGAAFYGSGGDRARVAYARLARLCGLP